MRLTLARLGSGRCVAAQALAAVLPLVGACGGAVSGASDDASTDYGSPPVLNDATANVEAGGNVGGPSGSSSGSGWSSSLNNPGPGMSTLVGSCPAFCSVDSDCANCAMPFGSLGPNCCVTHICAMMRTCPIRDSGSDALLDAGADSSVSDAADAGTLDAADGCACTPFYQSFRGPGFCGCCVQGVRGACSGDGVCIPITN